MKSQSFVARRWRWVFVFTIAIAGIATAEQVVVRVQSLVIRNGKGSMFSPVAEVPIGTWLDVVERQPDGWLKVKVNDKEGYLKETALTPRSPSMLGGASAGVNALTGNTSDVGAAAAARGIQEDANVYAANKGYKTDALQEMIANRNRVAGDPWLRFTYEAKIGPYKQQ
jgi:uncharacterized protein YgiM (DUF1202 family)